jgi:hypothetical protein
MSTHLISDRRERAIEIVLIAADQFLRGLLWGAGLVTGFMSVLWFIKTVGEWLA